MEGIFYAVQYVLNGRSGCLPTTFTSKTDAIEFANDLKRFDHRLDNVKTEVHMYEVREIEF